MENRFSPVTEDVLQEELENMRILFEDEELFTQAMNLAKKENPPTPTSPLTCTDESSSVHDIEELSPHLHSPTLELQDEVESLKSQLHQAQGNIKKLQAHIVKQRVQNNHVISVLKMQLQHSEEQLRTQRTKSDSQLGEVMAHLLFLEGQMKKEQLHIKCKMKDKDRLINQQTERIQKLTVSNESLLEALKDIYRRPGKNGLMLDNDFVSEGPPDSPVEKSPPGSGKSTPRKGRFGSMKDLMRRHRSSLDLSDAEVDGINGLVKNRQYSSSENLLMISRKNKAAREARDKKCRSIAGYPDGSLINFIQEVPDEGEFRFDHSDRSKLFSINDENQNRIRKSGNDLQTLTPNGHSVNSLAEIPASLLTATSMPILSQTEANQTPAKTRPKSISSIEHLSPEEREAQNGNSPLKSPGANSNSSFIESNPFKNLKTILKRKGSKMKSKKRSVTMADSPNQEQQDAIKKHFEKFDMS